MGCEAPLASGKGSVKKHSPAGGLLEEFGLVVTPEAVRQHLRSMGYSWKRTRYVPNKAPHPEQEREAREDLETLKRGAAKGEIVLKYLDESGFYLYLPPTHSWTKKGQAHQHRVKGRWGSEGRVNLMGTLCVKDEGQQHLEYRMLEGSCNSEEVLLYLDALADKAEPGVQALCGGFGQRLISHCRRGTRA